MDHGIYQSHNGITPLSFASPQYSHHDGMGFSGVKMEPMQPQLPMFSGHSSLGSADVDRIIASATHETLTRVQNAAYMQLFNHTQSLQASVATQKELLDHYRALLSQPGSSSVSSAGATPFSTRASTPMPGSLTASDGPRGILANSHGIPTVPLPPVLNPADFPNVPYWHKSSWDSKQNRTSNVPPQDLPPISDGKASRTNKKLLYLTDVNGQIISPDIHDQVTKVFYGCLQDLVPVLGTYFPHTWGAAGTRFKNYCIGTLLQHFEFLRYCSGYWKPELYCSIKWGDWARTHLPNNIKEQKAERKRAADEVIVVSDSEEGEKLIKKAKLSKVKHSVPVKTMKAGPLDVPPPKKAESATGNAAAPTTPPHPAVSTSTVKPLADIPKPHAKPSTDVPKPHVDRSMTPLSELSEPEESPSQPSKPSGAGVENPDNVLQQRPKKGGPGTLANIKFVIDPNIVVPPPHLPPPPNPPADESSKKKKKSKVTKPSEGANPLDTAKAPKKKRVTQGIKPTNSTTAKNLYLIDYLKENGGPISAKDYNDIWKAIDRNTKLTYEKKNLAAKPSKATKKAQKGSKKGKERDDLNEEQMASGSGTQQQMPERNQEDEEGDEEDEEDEDEEEG